ncbi:hypothetical protein BCR39DRAFT_518093 [Naematelia encephala]|uniref:Transmembrane protein n=1 Tax=Naematelia encephala TaxID=71784 RepID=A0A1Y2BHD3_9TREE|nr:hypothetical protein BCR39DRAFT_518093 [Naematelia encephala]
MVIDFPLDLPYDQSALRNNLESSIRAGKISASEYEACEASARWGWRGMLAGAGISLFLGPIALNRFKVTRANNGLRIASALASVIVGGGSGLMIGGLSAKQKFRDTVSSGNVNQMWDAFEEIKLKSRVHPRRWS